jgi:hypothetical protein
MERFSIRGAVNIDETQPLVNSGTVCQAGKLPGDLYYAPVGSPAGNKHSIWSKISLKPYPGPGNYTRGFFEAVIGIDSLTFKMTTTSELQLSVLQDGSGTVYFSRLSAGSATISGRVAWACPPAACPPGA